MSFEKNIERIEKILGKIEDSETGLEDAISLYKDGIALVKECGEVLCKHEEEVLVLQKKADKFILEPFSEERL
ncbi:MAG: exodeoxyribonuclease VII small subunit [Defluviitaleaceae bacterium]|nr:exodeoxyribonuclease VII small subunit [Defluviitaleaceae bacterium]